MATRHTHRYHVVTRGIANTLVHALTQNPSVEPISLERAREEHEHYVQLIKSLLSNSGNLHSKSVVHCIEASDMYPDCVFIEDTVVVVNDHVLINQLGAPSRRGEEEVVAEFFETNYPAKVIHYMKEMDPEATLDGGDVLTVEPAKVIYVGHSSRTNSKGIKVLQNVFCDFKVIPIKVERGLHLKSFCSYLACDKNGVPIIIVSGCEIGKGIASQIQQRADVSLPRIVFSGDLESSNCLSIPMEVNKYAIIRKKGFHTSDSTFNQLKKELGDIISIYELEYNELAKVDGALTCCSVIYPV
jgi:dimethylargininase